MDDMNAFERQVAGEVIRAAAPARPVDAAAVFAAITATQSPTWRFGSLFSATKFVVAGAIVALFGGFLLAGLLTQPSENQTPVVGASASPATSIPPAEDADAGHIVWTRVLIPGSEGSAWPALWSDGSYLVTADERGTVVSSNALDWLEVDPDFEQAVAAYDGTIAMVDDGRVRIVRTDGAGDHDSVPLADSIALPEGFASRTSGAIGPKGMVLVDCDGGCTTSTVWHTPDGRTWEQVYRTENELFEFVLATPDGFVARTERGGDYTMRYSADGHGWARINEEGLGSHEAVGNTSFGTVLQQSLGGEYPGGEGNLVLASADGLAPLDLPAPIEELRRSPTEPRWSAGALGLAGLFSDDREVVFTTDGDEWLTGQLPDEVPYLSRGWWGPVVHVAGEALLLQVPLCQDPAIDDDDPDGFVDCARDGTNLVGTAWYRGVPSRPAPEPSFDGPVDVATEAVALTDSSLLPGVDLVTEEVEPGVLRVLSDAAGHDLVAEPPAGITIAPDDSVWLMRAYSFPDTGYPGRFAVDAVLRLGNEGTVPVEPTYDYWSDFAVDADGVVWVGSGQDGLALSTWDGTSWTSLTWPDGSGEVVAVEATTDGAVWVMRHVERGSGPSVARIEDGDWTELPRYDDPLLDEFFVGGHAYLAAAPDGTAWLANGDVHANTPTPGALLHFDGAQWDVVSLPVGSPTSDVGPLALGPDGTLWVYVDSTHGGPGTDWQLLRLDADGWGVFSEGDGVPRLARSQRWEARMAVDATGAVWIGFGGDMPGPGDVPSGVLRFDGTTWSQYLEGLQVNRIAIADDGTVFGTARLGCQADCGDSDNWDWSAGGLYVITHEAVTAVD